jgi:hypothetical protein
MMVPEFIRLRAKRAVGFAIQREEIAMVNIYLFIELIRAANAADTADHLKSLAMDNCKFANVVVLSDEKLVAQLDCNDAASGNKALLEKIASVEGVVQSNIIAVVKPVKH